MRSARRERGGNGEERKEIRFWHTLFRKTKARAGGERKRSHQGPHRRAPGETETPGDRPRGFGDARGRIAVSLIGIGRAARGRLFSTPFGGLAQNTAKLKRLAFRKGLPPSCFGGAHATRRTRLFEKAPRARGPAVPTFRFPFVTPSLPPCFILCLFFTAFLQKYATQEMLERRRQEIFPMRGHAAPQRGDL